MMARHGERRATCPGCSKGIERQVPRFRPGDARIGCLDEHDRVAKPAEKSMESIFLDFSPAQAAFGPTTAT